MINNAALTALKRIRNGYNDLIVALEYEGTPSAMKDEAGALRCFDVPPERGLSREEASRVMLAHGYGSGSRFATFARQGWAARDRDRRYLTDAGRAHLALLDRSSPRS